MNSNSTTGSAILDRLIKTRQEVDDGIAFYAPFGRNGHPPDMANMTGCDPFLGNFNGLLPDVLRTKLEILEAARRALDGYIQLVGSSGEIQRAAFFLGISAAWTNLSLVGPEHIAAQQQRVLEAIEDSQQREASRSSSDRWLSATADPFTVLPGVQTSTQVSSSQVLAEYLAMLQEEERYLGLLARTR